MAVAPRIQIVRDEPQGSGTSVDVERYQHGWRSGKPVEDPDKLKRWGFIAAKPSEYLVCTRRGQIDRGRSGQGMRIFKWPWDAVAIVPTTLQRIEFVADQITRERVGVEITGVAVYRIAEPELAFRVLNFTYGEAASEKLAATLREMFVGAARRLVANLSLEECLTRRKETIATFLMEEIAPVVSGAEWRRVASPSPAASTPISSTDSSSAYGMKVPMAFEPPPTHAIARSGSRPVRSSSSARASSPMRRCRSRTSAGYGAGPTQEPMM
jgi:hypothetical protein